jgi:hypothetical protein
MTASALLTKSALAAHVPRSAIGNGCSCPAFILRTLAWTLHRLCSGLLQTKLSVCAASSNVCKLVKGKPNSLKWKIRGMASRRTPHPATTEMGLEPRDESAQHSRPCSEWSSCRHGWDKQHVEVGKGPYAMNLSHHWNALLRRYLTAIYDILRCG